MTVEPQFGMCPVCRHNVRLSPLGNVGPHHGDRMRWSGRRWFRNQCRGVGRRPIAVPAADQKGAPTP